MGKIADALEKAGKQERDIRRKKAALFEGEEDPFLADREEYGMIVEEPSVAEPEPEEVVESVPVPSGPRPAAVLLPETQKPVNRARNVPAPPPRPDETQQVALPKSWPEVAQPLPKREPSPAPRRVAGPIAKKLKSRRSGVVPPDKLSLLSQGQNYTFSEQFRMLRTFLIHRSEKGPPPKTIMVTSALPGEGKTMTSVNLAINIAMGMEEHVLLVDSDLRMPSVSRFLGVETDLGLADYLMRGDMSLNEVLYSTQVEKLTLLPAGSGEPNAASELLSSEKMRSLIAEVRERYEDRFVIFDTPPVKATADPSVLAEVMDAILLVVRSGYSSEKIIEESVHLLGKDKIKGLIFNFADERDMNHGAHYKYGNYGYGYGYGHKPSPQ